MLEFSAETKRLLDRAYAGSDVVRRRMANFRALDPRPGEAILDLGCGQGLLTAELARAVGDGGSVTGLDPSPDMLAGARETCAGFDNVTLLEGSAGDIPADNASFDRIVSLQVFEYIDDIPAALTAVRRVLKPGGRLVIGDMHWDSFLMHSDHPDRMQQMMRLWDHHLADRIVPARLPRMLADSGYVHEATIPLPITDTCLRADGLANMMIHLMSGYAKQHAHLPEDDVDAWQQELSSLAGEGRFFFAITHYVTVARRA